MAVARQLHIQLGAVGSERDRVFERRERILGPERGTAAMGEAKDGHRSQALAATWGTTPWDGEICDISAVLLGMHAPGL
jgi:hypothetical protein